MKKILFLALMVVGVNVNAQTYSANLAVIAAEDTLTNTDTAYLTATIDYKADLHFKLTQTKVSGTVGGAAILQGSVDNSQWFSINTTEGDAAASQYQDTATITNGTASYWWKVPYESCIYKYWRIRVITSGTQVSAPTGKVYSKKDD